MRATIPRLAAAALAVGLVAAGCGGRRTDPPTAAPGANAASCRASAGQITIATGNIGGVYHAVGSGIARLITDNTDLQATGAETGGSGQNIQQLINHDHDIALAEANIVLDAVNGKGLFDGEPQPLRVLTRLYPEYLHVLVHAGSGIDGVGELRGRRVSTGVPKSGTESAAHQLLDAAGLDPGEDIQAQRLDLGKSADGFKAGTIDGFIWTGGLPLARITDVTSSLGDEVRFLDITPQIDAMVDANPLYEPAAIPADTYPGQPDAVRTITGPSMLLVRDDFPVNDACAITKLIFSGSGDGDSADVHPDLAEVHRAARQIELDEARKTGPVIVHPGAEQALDALGAPPGA